MAYRRPLPPPSGVLRTGRPLLVTGAGYALLWLALLAAAAGSVDGHRLRASAGIALALAIGTAAHRALRAPDPTRRLFWRLLAISFVIVAAGTLLGAVGELAPGPWSVLGLLGFLIGYPVMLVALVLRAVQEESLAGGLATALDVAVLVLSLVVVTAPFVVGPLVSGGSAQDVATAVIWVGNLALLAGSVWVFYRLSPQRHPQGMATIVVALVAFTALAVVQAALKLHAPGGVLPWFLTLAYIGPYLLLWVAPSLDTPRSETTSGGARPWSLVRLALPYAVFLPMACMWFAVAILGPRSWLVPLAGGALGVAVLVVARQLLLLGDHRRLLMERSEQALRDGLTGLLNRRAFDGDLRALLASAARRSGQVALLTLDVDSLKVINDACGHAAGDAAIRAVGDALAASVRRGDRAYRLGGDEFAALLVDGSDEAATRVLAETRLRLHSHQLGCLTVSAGAAVYPEDADDPELLRIRADGRLYGVKHGQPRLRRIL